MSYSSSTVRFEREGDKVTPVKVTKMWVEPPEKSKLNRQFMSVRSTIVPFRRPSHGPDDWRSSKVPPADRGALVRAGLIIPEGHGKCLLLDDPTTWLPQVYNQPPPWADPEAYAFGTDESE